MARPKKDAENKEESQLSVQDILGAQLKANKEDHFNDQEEIVLPKVSSGSLILDAQLGGGFDAGLHRFVGFTEGGKTSECLEITRNFLNTIPSSRALLVKAEGRLSKDMQDRSGLKYVWKTEDWVEGTCFVLETNVYELAIGVMRDLVVNNPENKNKFIFILDSIDALILKDDLEKPIDGNNKVAGGPALTKKFMQRMAIAMNKFGHQCLMIGQVSAKVEISQYGPKDQRQISATGGNAAMHFANWILQFEPRYKDDMILENSDLAPDPIKNKILGHWCKIIIKKSPNEKSNLPVRYPVKYGRTGGASIWREYEIVDTLMMFEKVSKKNPRKIAEEGAEKKKGGAWLYLDIDIYDQIKEATGIEPPEKFQGVDNLRKYLEENPTITNFLFDTLKRLIAG